MRSPAQRLLGLTLDGGWRVVELFSRDGEATGGLFSVGYIVEAADRRRAYLKALDFSRALRSDDPATELEALTAAYNFERAVLQRCRAQRMSRVVVAIDAGKVVVDDSTAGVVQYIIFELADGDVRRYLHFAQGFDLAWTLRALHHVATGLHQLHGQGIAHQDLKPSNVMVFSESATKVGDLGRAAYQGHPAPHEERPVAGDPAYAPPELLYKHLSPDWNQRRCGCDAYLLGSLIVFFFTGAGMTSLLMTKLGPSHHWRAWRGSFGEILPYLRDGFGQVLLDFSEAIRHEGRDELVTMVRQLCDPDPERRGHPKTRAALGNPYSLERYVSLLDRLAQRAELGLLRNL